MCRAQAVPVTRLLSNMPATDALSDRLSIMAENTPCGSQSRAWVTRGPQAFAFCCYFVLLYPACSASPVSQERKQVVA